MNASSTVWNVVFGGNSLVIDILNDSAISQGSCGPSRFSDMDKLNICILTLLLVSWSMPFVFVSNNSHQDGKGIDGGHRPHRS